MAGPGAPRDTLSEGDDPGDPPGFGVDGAGESDEARQIGAGGIKTTTGERSEVTLGV
jgi:hypothetical protein